MLHRQRYEDYLVTIYRLEEALGEAKTSDIARELKVSPATVSKVIRQLESKGFVKREKYHYVKLIGRGRKIAELVVRKHRIAEVFLSNILGFNELDSHSYAHYLEHLPDVVIEKLYAYTNYPQYCPHGNDIPSPSSGDVRLK
ncbi:MAG: metal-dependent transcriptional regulator [Desulfurococcaceae archaeon]